MIKKFKKIFNTIATALAVSTPLIATTSLSSCGDNIDKEFNADLLFKNLEEFVNDNSKRFTTSIDEIFAAGWIVNKLMSFDYDKKENISQIPAEINRDDREFFMTEGISLQNFDYQFRGVTERSTNILLSIPANNATLETKNIILTCHYDSYISQSWGKSPQPKTQGVTDNATGVAALLTLAQFFSIYGNNTSYNVQLLFCGAEESGTNGSRVFSHYFFGYYDPSYRIDPTLKKEVQLWGTTNVDSFEYCINLDTLAGGDYVYCFSPWSQMKETWNGDILINDITYSNWDGSELDSSRCITSNKEVSNAILETSNKIDLDEKYILSESESLFEMDASCLSYNNIVSNSARLNLKQEGTDASDHFAFYVVGIKTANLVSKNVKINMPGAGFNKSQTIDERLWEYGLKAISQIDSGLDFVIYESLDYTEERMNGTIWHTELDRFDALEELFGLEHIKQQFYGAWKSVFKFVLSL